MSLEERLRRRLRQSGPIPFAEFMEVVLYGPGGYYAGQELRILAPDSPGDYATASSLSPLFGRTTARLLDRLDSELGGPAELLEAGYGNGAHLRAVLTARGQDKGRVRGWDRTQRSLPAGVEPVARLEDVAPGEVSGLVFSYELFDALPVHRLVARQKPQSRPHDLELELGELWVGLNSDGELCWQEGELSDPSLARLLVGAEPLVAGQIADLSPQWATLYRQLAQRLGRGLLVTCDYGFEMRKLLDPRIRLHGTLACYSSHRVHRNPFVLLGRQDLTAHVNFSALREAGEEAGLETVAFTRQARWLTANGLFQELDRAPLATRHQAMALLDPGGVGEEIRVLVQSRGVGVDRLLDLEVLGRRQSPASD